MNVTRTAIDRSPSSRSKTQSTASKLDAPSVKVAYLINQYPLASHAAFRREILALERLGCPVARYSIRCTKDLLVDETDIEEEKKTRAILSEGKLSLLLCAAMTALTRPGRFIEAFRAAVRLGRTSDRGVLRHLAYLIEACTLRKWLVAGGIEHIHAHFATNSTTVPMLSRILGGPPYSFTVHGPEEFDKAVILGMGEKIERSAFVVAISDFCRGQLFRWCSHDQWSKVRVVRCGLDDMFLEHAVTDVPTTPRFVCVGRICEQKGQLLLVEAASRLRDEGHEFELLLVGDGEMKAEVERYVAEKKLEDCVKLTGVATSTQVRDFILESRAMVLPSFAEGLPMVLMEAMALGRPVISTYIAGIPELVDSDSGWLIISGSVDHVTDAMRSALTTPQEVLESMGRHGREQAIELHNAMTESGKLIEHFTESAERERSQR